MHTLVKATLLVCVTVISCLQQVCHDTSFEVGDKKYNVNHLKNHLPPFQDYSSSERGNLYGLNPDDKNSYVFFNLMDVIYKQKVGSHNVEPNCQPRSVGPPTSINTPVACIPEPNTENCLGNTNFCWLAIGSCKDVTPAFIDETDQGKGINLLYKGGDIEADWFLVTLQCCKAGDCIKKAGLDTPAKFMTSGCALDAKYCVELASPFGCDCETRALLDTALGKSEFHCDVTPSGIVSGTSTGTYLVIFLFAGIILYLGIGMGYNYSEGRRGEEMVPHLEMWKDLGGLIYDGLRYVTSCGEYREGVQYDTIG